MAKPFEQLWDEMSPERRERIDTSVRESLTQMLMAELRKAAGVPVDAETEDAHDMPVETLRRLVETLGGELVLTVKLPGGRQITVSETRDTPHAA